MKYTFIFLFISFACFSQSSKINGLVLDGDQKPVSNVLASLLSSDKTIISYQYTDNDGKFSFKKTPGSFYVKISSLFFEDVEKTLDASSQEEIVFNLTPKKENLKEVVLVSKRINRDTTNLNIQNYNITKTESIEQTLKKIPGMSIDNEGRIKYWNKEIEKILIDGDDLADDQYTFISKNLRSMVLKDIQVLKNFEENTVLKKTQKSDKIALNLKVKDDFKNIWFGNIEAGYGDSFDSNQEIDERLNLALIKKRIKFLNAQEFSTLGDKSIPISFSNNDNETYDLPLYSVKNIDVPLTPEITNFNDGFSNTFLINKKIKKIALRSSNFIGIDTQKQESFTRTDFIFQDESQTEINNNKKRNLLFEGDLELKYDGTDDHYFVNTLNYKLGSSSSTSAALFNDSNTTDAIESKRTSIYNNLLYTTRLKNGLVLNNLVDIGYARSKEDITINSENLSSFFTSDAAIYQDIQRDFRFIDIQTEASYFFTRKLKGTFKTIYKNNTEDFDISLPPSTSTTGNNIRFKRSSLIFDSRLYYKISKRIELKGGISQNNFKLDKIKKPLLNYNAALLLNFYGELELSYAKKQEFLPNRNFLENYYLTNNNTLTRGGRLFEPLNFEYFKFRLNNKNKKNTYNNELSFTYTKSKNSLLENYSLEDNINFNNLFLVSRLGKNYTFKEQLILLIKTVGLKFETIQSFSTIPLNGTISSETDIYNSTYTAEFTSYFSSPFNFNIKAEYLRNTQKTENISSAFDSKNLIADFTWNVNKEITFDLNGGFYEFDNNYYNIVNTNLNYTPDKSNFSYGITVNNLLGENQFLYQQRNSFFTSITSIPLVPFYTFASVKYIF